MSFIYSLTTTWNDAAVTYTGIGIDASNGAGGAPVGAAASRLFNLKNNGTSVFSVNKDGNVAVAGQADIVGNLNILGNITVGVPLANTYPFTVKVLTNKNMILRNDVVSGLGGVLYYAINDAENALVPAAVWCNNFGLYQCKLTMLSSAITLKSFTVALLPAGVTGDTVFATDCRVFNGTGTQEGAGLGTGGLVTYNGTNWKIAGTNVTAVA